MADEGIDFENLDEADSLLSFHETSQEASGRFVLTTLGEVAELFGVALQTAKEWRQASPPLPGEPGNYPMKELIRWRFARVNHNELSDELRREQVDKLRVATESARIDLEKLKASVLDRADVELWAAHLIVEARESLMQLPEMLAASAPENLKSFVRSESDQHVRGVLASLARRLELAEIGRGVPD